MGTVRFRRIHVGGIRHERSVVRSSLVKGRSRYACKCMLWNVCVTAHTSLYIEILPLVSCASHTRLILHSTVTLL